jgi:large subunit ribosomal protein L17
MGHQDKVKKLGRTKPHREAMLANMAMSLFTHKIIRTTDAKAKALRPVVDRIISRAKKDTLASKRQVAKTIRVKEVFKTLYSDIVPAFEDKNSGFTRVIKLGVRRGDGAPMSIVELAMDRKSAEADTKGKKKGKLSRAVSRKAGSKGIEKKEAKAK